jgi:hypothetical protein
MRFKIAHDARPQATTLIFAAALSVLLWFIPYAELLTYPFRIFVTFIHEGGHALAALVTGGPGAVHSLNVSMDGSGEVYSMTGGLFSKMLVSSAGYLGAMTFGALLLLLIRRTVAARIVLAGSAALILFLTVFFGFLAPVWNLSLPGLFTLVAGVVLPLGLFAAARYASPKVATFLVSFLAVQCVLNAVFDLKTVLFMSVAGGQTDAANMEAATGLPAIFWSLFWFALAFAIVSLALRAYAVSRDTPTQPDLPFEDSPLEV